MSLSTHWATWLPSSCPALLRETFSHLCFVPAHWQNQTVKYLKRKFPIQGEPKDTGRPFLFQIEQVKWVRPASNGWGMPIFKAAYMDAIFKVTILDQNKDLYCFLCPNSKPSLHIFRVLSGRTGNGWMGVLYLTLQPRWSHLFCSSATLLSSRSLSSLDLLLSSLVLSLSFLILSSASLASFLSSLALWASSLAWATSSLALRSSSFSWSLSLTRRGKAWTHRDNPSIPSSSFQGPFRVTN